MKDSLVAESTSQAYAELSRRGLMPVQLREGGSRVVGEGRGVRQFWEHFSGSGRVDAQKASRREMSFFISQMAILLETGTPVASSLEALKRQFGCRHWQQLISELHQHVEEGGTLGSGVEMYPHVFDPVCCSMISETQIA